MKKEQWYDIFDRSKNAGKSLVRMYNFASALATVVTIGIIAIAISYVLITTNLIFTVRNTFLPTSDVTLVPSSSPSCVGDYTLTVGDNSIDCLGTSPSKVVCANGYEGVLFEGVLLCPIDNQIILPGSQCANGGFVLFYQNVNQTFNVTTCFAIEPSQVTCANGLPGIQLGNVTVCNVQFASTGTGTVSLIQNSTISSLTVRELQSNVPHLSITATNGAAVFSSDIICSDGRPSALFNGVAYCNLFMNVTSSAATCNGGTRYDLYGNGTLLQHFCSSQQLTNSSSVDFITTANTVTANAKVTTSDATTGGETLVSSYAGNNIIFKQLFDIPGFLEYSSTSTSVQLVSFIDANNIPWTGFNPLLFPDCPLSTDISDFLTCLAGRTISSLTNITAASQVIYYPSTPFRNQSAISVATAFDILFEDTLPAFTRTWYVDSVNGDDELGNGSPVNPFKTIGKTFSLIGTFSFNQANEVRTNIGTYNEGPLAFPPNTYINADGSLRTIVVNVNGSITLRSDWATYANDHVEGGMTGVVLTATSVILNFTGMGATGVNSNSKFSFAQTEVNAPITVNGRSNVDSIHFNTVDLIDLTTVNCVKLHLEESVIEGDFIITDNACSATVLNYHIQFNYFEHSNITIAQSTSSGMVVDLFLNGWDQAYVLGYGNFTCNTYTVPINFLMAGTVNIVHNLNLAGSTMCGLDITYWGASCLSADALILILMGRAKDQVSVGTSTSLLATSTSTEDRVKGLIDGANIVITNDATDVMISTSSNPSFSSLTLTGTPLSIGSGGTGSSSLTANGIVGMNGAGTAQTSTPLTNGQTLIGSTGGSPVAASLTGITNQVSVTNGPGSITLSIPTAFIAPGTIKDTSGMHFSTTNFISTTGTTQGTATVIVSSFNIVTSSLVGAGVVLPVPTQTGMIVIVENNAAVTINVWPQSGAAIDNAATNSPVTIPVGTSAQYVSSSGTKWYCVEAALLGSGGISISYGNGITTATMTSTPTFTSATLSNTINQLTFGTVTTTTITSPTPASSRTYTIPDVLSDTSFVMGAGAQTIAGAKTFTSAPISSANVGYRFNNAGNTQGTTLTSGTGLASSFSIGLPITTGDFGQTLQTDGATTPQTSWVSAPIRLYTATASAVVASTNVLTTIISGTGVGSLTISANTLRVGSEIDIFASGIISCLNVDTGRIDVTLSGTTITSIPATDMGAVFTNVGFIIQSKLIVRSIGVGGTAIGEVTISYNGGTMRLSSTTTVTAAIDTTTSKVLNVLFKFSTASASNTITTVVFTSNIIY